VDPTRKSGDTHGIYGGPLDFPATVRTPFSSQEEKHGNCIPGPQKRRKKMSAPTPCLRHTEHKWLAYCSDCTTWHLARLIAARDNAARDNGARVPTTTRPAVVRTDRRHLTVAA
jgi:hypothetical protein